jgi:hypothetical protein
MEISKLNRRAQAEVAHFCHFTDPATGDPMMDGETALGAMVLGASAKSVQAALTAKQRAAMSAKVDPKDEVGLERHQKMAVEDACLVTVELVGFTSEGKAIAADGFADFYDLTFFDVDVSLGRKDARFGSWAQQVWAFSNRQANFLPKA